jgi:hypothetical protein
VTRPVVTTAVKPAPPGSLDTAPTAHGSTSPGQSTAARPGGRISGSNREIRAYQKIKSDEAMVARARRWRSRPPFSTIRESDVVSYGGRTFIAAFAAANAWLSLHLSNTGA